ncbi:MAG: hypothetical protein ABH839_01320 [Chloroflexota bacterium]
MSEARLPEEVDSIIDLGCWEGMRQMSENRLPEEVDSIIDLGVLRRDEADVRSPITGRS